eukprot:gb/GFBE01036945.1/.p1 GENE.gb/GFBE01036945.1/~~gb/GFBE01036945.1/.p1  ORF type:complete len:172 (+),score=42.40 gb/GFBE01036945.1/:1-516(+)
MEDLRLQAGSALLAALDDGSLEDALERTKPWASLDQRLDAVRAEVANALFESLGEDVMTPAPPASSPPDRRPPRRLGSCSSSATTVEEASLLPEEAPIRAASRAGDEAVDELFSCLVPADMLGDENPEHHDLLADDVAKEAVSCGFEFLADLEDVFDDPDEAVDVCDLDTN